MKCILTCLIFSFIFNGIVYPQRSNFNERKSNVHRANKIRTTFHNDGIIGKKVTPEAIGGEWPINSGFEYFINLAFMVGTKIKAQNIDTLVASVEVANPMVGPCEINPVTFKARGWEPLPGYSNKDRTDVAMSHEPITWPSHWPDKLSDPYDPGWPGKWNGFFGKDQSIDGQESFYIVDDNSDDEFNFYPDSADSTRRGLGLKVKVRGLQWREKLLEDTMIWIYDLENEGTTDYDEMFFAMINFILIGGDDLDDFAHYLIKDSLTNKMLNLGYGSDQDGMGYYGKVGHFGLAFLQTPGNASDGLDNDEDGMIDESQSDGIDNDNDWNPATDDLGLDGLPGTFDQGEGNGVPDSGANTSWPGEPNIDKTDPDEIDQLGLTSFVNFYPYNSVLLYNDEQLFHLNRPGSFVDLSPEKNGQGDFMMGTGYFALPAKGAARIAVAMVYGSDKDDLMANLMNLQSHFSSHVGVTAVDKKSKKIPSLFSLAQNHPNPFNAKTKIKFTVSFQTHVKLSIFDILGRRISTLFDHNVQPGEYQVEWNAIGCPSGVYLCKLQASDFTVSHKLVLIP